MSEWYTSEVWFLFWKLPAQYFQSTKPSDIPDTDVLKAIRPIWRPFCRVKWVKA